MPQHSMVATRARRRGHAQAPDPRPRGPPPSTAPLTRQRRHALRNNACRKWVAFIAQMMQKDIMPRAGFDGITDLARMKWLSSEAARADVPRECRVALLILDWACRSPTLTSAIVDHVKDLGEGVRAWTLSDVVRVISELRATGSHTTFWKGPSLLCLTRFLANVTAEDLELLAVRLASPRVRCLKLRRAAEELPHLGAYLGFALLRGVAHALELKLRDDSEAAASMSAHTNKVSSVIPMQKVAHQLHMKVGVAFPTAFMAWVTCEATKILLHEGVLDSISSYEENDDRLLLALNSSKMLRVVQLVTDMPSPRPSAPDAETAALHREIPADSVGPTVSGNALSRWRAMKSGQQ